MDSLADRLLRSAACSRRFLDGGSRDKIARFTMARQNPDGGFRGRGAESDLYYTVFAVATLKAIGDPIPVFKVWKYIRSFGMGDDLDLVHLVCLIQLRTAFPMLGTTRRRLFKRLDNHRAESAYGLFLKLLAGDCLDTADYPDEPLRVSSTDPTPNLAAEILVNRQGDEATTGNLLARARESGGFAPTEQMAVPDLLSTATALFALTSLGIDLDAIQQPCFKYIESLWRDSGGFAGHVADEFEDVEYTFYALLGIGCLIQSLASDYGK
ncbi:MAG: prenyltransferase/squalene oxidase repeat-containing protein [Verrucomicrobiota bacterium]|nr:prenyltransferase/squalene oxidase repeat-containing protein [Verrucomicrobiota bacterium]